MSEFDFDGIQEEADTLDNGFDTEWDHFGDHAYEPYEPEADATA